jgi:hypothetical protein
VPPINSADEVNRVTLFATPAHGSLWHFCEAAAVTDPSSARRPWWCLASGSRKTPPARAGSRRPAGRERMPAGSANGLLVRVACTKAERRKERGGHSATAPARFELWSAIVTPNKVAPAVRKVLARFPGKAAPTGITRKTRRKRRRK